MRRARRNDGSTVGCKPTTTSLPKQCSVINKRPEIEMLTGGARPRFFELMRLAVGSRSSCLTLSDPHSK